MALKSYTSQIRILKITAALQLALILGFLLACIGQLGGAMGGEPVDYLKAFLFDGVQAVLSINISAAAMADRKLGMRRFSFWVLVAVSVTFNLYYKWCLIDTAAGFQWADLAKLSAADLYVQVASNIILGLGIVILTETRNDTLKDAAFFVKEEARLETQRTKRKIKRESVLEQGQSESVGAVQDLTKPA